MDRSTSRLGRFRLVGVALCLLGGFAAPNALAGPIIISGMDPEDHGAPGVQMIRDIMQFVVSESSIYLTQNRPSPSKILQLGGTGGPIGFSATDAAVVAGTLGYTLTVVNGANILSVAFEDYDAIYMPTCSINLFPPLGGLSAADLELINQRAADFVDFVNAGGGIIAFAQNDIGGYGWFPLGGLQSVDLGESGQIGVTVTPDGLEILNPSATAVEPFHTAFVGPPGFFGLEILAHESFGDMRPLIIGGPGNTCIGQLLMLEPDAATNVQCTDHTVQATASRSQAPCGPFPGVTVDFVVLTGPNAGASGSDVTDSQGHASFTYTGNGGAGVDEIQASFFDPDAGHSQISNVVTKTWIASGAPVIGQGASLAHQVNRNSTCPGLPNQITLTATDPDSPAGALTWSIQSPPSTGTATFIGGSTGGSVVVCYQPNPNQNASDSFVVKVDDGCGGVDTIDISITVVNAPPVISPPSPYDLTVQKNSVCPNPNNRVTLTATDPDGAAAGLTWSITQPPATGTAIFLGPQTGGQVIVCYQPNANQIAPDSFIVRVMDAGGASASITVNVTVLNEAPVIAQPDPYFLAVNRNTVCPNPNNRIQLNASDPDGSAATLVWDIATPPATGTVVFLGPNSGGQVIVCYQPNPHQNAPDTFVVRVTDDCGGVDTITIRITVINQPPTITQGPGAAITVQKNSTCPNPANQLALSAIDLDGQPAALIWSVTIPPATGTVTFVGGNTGSDVTVCYQPNPGQIASDNFTVTVTDDGGATDAISVAVTVLNTPPTINQGSAIAIEVPKNGTCSDPATHVALSATDPDGDSAVLSWSVTTGPATGIVTFVGSQMGPSVVVCYEPNANQMAADSFVVQVSDDCGGTDVITVSVTVLNSPPEIDPAGPVALSVGKNTSCPNPANQVSLTADDPDGDEHTLAWTIATPPSNGTASFVGGTDGGASVAVCYAPSADSVAPDVFVVRVTDDCGGTDEVTINVTVVNLPPEISPAGPVSLSVAKNSVCPGAANQVSLTATDPDADASLLVWTVSSAPGTGTASFVGPSTGGSVTVCYQPNPDQIAGDTFTVRVDDGRGGMDEVVVNVTVVNAPPVIDQGNGPLVLAVAQNSLCPGAANQVALSATDPDQDESELVWSIAPGPAHGVAVFVGGATGGSVTVCYQPNPNQTSPDSFTVVVDDGCGGVDTIVVQVTVDNDPPVIGQTGPIGLTVQKNSLCPNAANQVNLTATDPDADESLLSWTIASPGPATGTVSFVGGINTGGSVTVCYQPDADQMAADSFVVVVADAQGGMASITVNVTVLNSAPVISPEGPIDLSVQKNSVCPNAANQVSLTAADPDQPASSLAWTISTPPAHGTVSFVGVSTGGAVTVCYQPFADQMSADSFVVLVDDLCGGTDSVTIHVSVINDPPVIDQVGPIGLSVGQNTPCPGAPNQVSLSATDPDSNEALLVWSVISGPATGTVTFVGGASGGAVTVCYAPDPNQTASDTFTVQVSDDCGGTDTIQIMVTIDNQPPQIDGGSSLAVTVQKNSNCEDAANRVQLSATDPDSDPAALMWTISTAPASGSANFVGGNMGANVVLCYTPDFDQVAADSFVVTVSDSDGGVDSIAVNVTVNNSPPVIDQGESLNIFVQLNSVCSGTANVALSATDPDAGEIPMNWTISTPPALGSASFVGSPHGTAITICYQPATNQISGTTFIVTVDDKCGGTDSITIHVAMRCPGSENDCNGNGIADGCEIAVGDAQDCNENGVPDSCDIASGEFPDCNGNGVPDVCDLSSGTSSDCNDNGIPDECDIAGGTSNDCNGNGIPDECDLDPADPDGNGQVSPDCNGNGVPDECDLAGGASKDCNGNGIPDECDIAQGTVPDCNGNGIPDGCELADGSAKDCNGNGVPDSCDIAGGVSKDCNGNGIPDECDINPADPDGNGQVSGDCNGNGIPDECEIANGSLPDCNGNGVPDACDIGGGASKDCNANGIPDECDVNPNDPDGDGTVSPDCNKNGIPDNCEIASGAASDCNGNGVPDSCDIAGGASGDCNGNGVPDECDVNPADPDHNGFVSPDCNANGIPDECDLHILDPDGNGVFSADCNMNNIPDECEIAAGTVADCNKNGIPDSCDIASGASSDCNGNGVPDACDLALDDPDGNGSVSPDCNLNGIPDECDINLLDPDGDGKVSQDCNGNGIPDECDIASGFSMDVDGNGIPDECPPPVPQPVPGCDPNEVGLNVLTSVLFHAPVCGPGCLTLIPFGLLGMVVMKSGYRRTRRPRARRWGD